MVVVSVCMDTTTSLVVVTIPLATFDNVGIEPLCTMFVVGVVMIVISGVAIDSYVVGTAVVITDALICGVVIPSTVVVIAGVVVSTDVVTTAGVESVVVNGSCRLRRPCTALFDVVIFVHVLFTIV
jgi:hypothetical protein